MTRVDVDEMGREPAPRPGSREEDLDHVPAEAIESFAIAGKAGS
jgi:hypothetical protein